jgi:hypothetical protein
VFKNKKHNQVATCVGLSTSGIDILSLCVTGFNKSKMRVVEKYLLSLILGNVVLDIYFFDKIRDPDKITIRI